MNFIKDKINKIKIWFNNIKERHMLLNKKIKALEYEIEMLKARMDYTKESCEISSSRIDLTNESVAKLKNEINNSDSITDKVINNEKFNSHIQSYVNQELNLDKYTFEKRISLSNLRRSISYDSVMDNIRHIINGVADNYLIKKYIKVDGYGGYRTIKLTAKDMLDDMSEIYDNTLSIINMDIITDDLGAFYDPFKIRTKEYFISQIIEPIYRNKIHILIQQYKAYVENQVFVPTSIYDKTETEEENPKNSKIKDFHKRIDEALSL